MPEEVSDILHCFQQTIARQHNEWHVTPLARTHSRKLSKNIRLSVFQSGACTLSPVSSALDESVFVECLYQAYFVTRGTPMNAPLFVKECVFSVYKMYTVQHNAIL